MFFASNTLLVASTPFVPRAEESDAEDAAQVPLWHGVRVFVCVCVCVFVCVCVCV